MDVASVRAEPREDAEQLTQALLDEPLAVVERLGGWARIVTAYDYAGWIREDAVAEGEGVWPEALGGDPVSAARSFLGAPYEWGGLTRGGIDCSGLVHMAFRLVGRLVPRDSWQQERYGEMVSRARAGDLVTYGDGGRADHIAFWLGDGRILHATAREGLGVVEEDEPAELAAKRRRFLQFQ